MQSLRVTETKLTLRNAFILDLFALGGEKESKYNERTPYERPIKLVNVLNIYDYSRNKVMISKRL